MHTNPSKIGIGVDDPLLPQATAWLEQLRSSGEAILVYPVSRLQREFRIGYSRTCAMLEALAVNGCLTIAFAADGTRLARLHPKLEE